jgi:hypothetical protein
MLVAPALNLVLLRFMTKEMMGNLSFQEQRIVLVA